MLTLLRRADVYAPRHIGLRDILLADGKIACIRPSLDEYVSLPDVAVYEAGGRRTVPGLIDLHIHATGGGGEQGFASRVPEIALSELTLNGVTSFVGLLGTDGTTRSLENLLAKCRALEEEGVTAYMLTGSYQYPTQTLTGSVVRDIVLIDKIIGVKVALSDHRSSNLTEDELIRLGSDARLGGLLSGKPGLVTIHMGDGSARLSKLFAALEHSDIPIKTFLPTHVARNDGLLQSAVEFAKRGGNIDITACDTQDGRSQASRAVAACLAQGAPLDALTLSSDACGSQPRFDAQGNCIGLTYTSPRILLDELRRIVTGEHIPLEDALRLLTSNPAARLGQTGRKGAVCEGADADLVLLDDGLRVDAVFAKGRLAVDGKRAVIKGTFER